ncbi:TetR/AcrR family transcriptional regulator [Aquipuribacter sp. MA13-6]|uniref:TetR/AcrR family transcriptional regulator n=1 Tax=unclassified Aquipuribacter TaxID=2635084 RepID=UPI003EF02243
MSARGQQRREALVSAAAALLGRDGPHALSARAVATEAGVPLAAVSYYFDTVDDLVRAAAERLYDGYLAVATALLDRAAGGGRVLADDRDVAALVVRVWLDPTDAGPDPQRVRSLLVSLASAADSPALAPRLRRYDESLQGLVVRLLEGAGRDPGRVRVLLAALDGFALARLSGVPLLAVPTADLSATAALSATELLAGLTEDLLLVWDDLAPPLTG